MTAFLLIVTYLGNAQTNSSVSIDKNKMELFAVDNLFNR